MERSRIRTQSPVPAMLHLRRVSVGPNETDGKSVSTINRLSRSSMFMNQLTPPATPSPTLEEPARLDPPPLHSYLRASHHFNPDSDAGADPEASAITVPICRGDMILVHSVHASGWADGTVLTTSNRGWLPTNYCKPYDHPHVRNLLSATTQVWDILGVYEGSSTSPNLLHDCVKAVIAGVRFLLEHALCMHRDAALVKSHVGIRRMRKGLLADLSTLVQRTKHAQSTAGETKAGSIPSTHLDEVLPLIFKVVTRAVKFVDVWEQETSNASMPPQTSPARRYTTYAGDRRLTVDTDLAEHGKPVGDVHFVHDPQSPALPSENTDLDNENASPQRGMHGTDVASTVTITPSDGVTSRASNTITDPTRKASLASEQLAEAHDLCISSIGEFIGNHLQSRIVSELASVSDKVTSACKLLLAIVDEVSAHDFRLNSPVQDARVQFQATLEELILARQDGFMFSDQPDDGVVMLPQQSSRLVLVATSLIRTAADCVSRTRALINQTGDFELTDPAATSGIEQFYSPVEHFDPFVGATHAESGHLARRASSPGVDASSEMYLFPAYNDSPRRPAKRLSRSAEPVTAPEAEATDLAFDGSPLRSQAAQAQAQQVQSQAADGLSTARERHHGSVTRARNNSTSASITGSTETAQSSARYSKNSANSSASTRATTPDHAKDPRHVDPALLNSFGSLSSIRSVAAEIGTDAEAHLLQKTFAHELMLNKDGQIIGGTLAALVEQLTMHEHTPDAQFTTAFFLTFRLFTSPSALVAALTDRFNYIGDNQAVATPTRLRIFNVLKGWLETYWSADADKDALGEIRHFAIHNLRPQMPSIADRLLELVRRVSAAYSSGTMTSPLVSGIGKLGASVVNVHCRACPAPEVLITKSQLNSLRAALTSAGTCCITDLEPVEIARQLTLMASQLLCKIDPQELLTLDWNKKGKVGNVRAVSTMNTQLAYFVNDSVLTPEDAKKRALVIKHWVKVAMHCVDLKNYESLTGIVGSLNSTIVLRLKRTWDLVSKKTKARLDELNALVDPSRNYKNLRSKLETPAAPCLPFLGIYLTDLTFIDAGNPNEKELPGSMSDAGKPVVVVNFDKYMRMARIIDQAQLFQVPYRLHPVFEVQDWIETCLQKMPENPSEAVAQFHQRSKALEPNTDGGPPASERQRPDNGVQVDRPRLTMGKTEPSGSFGAFLKNNGFSFKTAAPPPSTSATIPYSFGTATTET